MDSLKTHCRDFIPWKVWPVPARITAIGDVHGDLEALISILLERSLVTKKGKWCGGKTHLVLNGDLVGGSQSRLLVHFVMRLEKQARNEGGRVHALLGNHDLLVLASPDYSTDDAHLFREYPVPGAKEPTLREAFRGNTAMARWLRRRNAILKIGDTLFVHAGLNSWALDHHPARINATIRSWIKFFQGVGKKPDNRTRWTIGLDETSNSEQVQGPMWTRAYKLLAVNNSVEIQKRTRAPSLDTMTRILSKYHTRRMVLAHDPLDFKKILLIHPYYREMVVMIDTRISDQKKGILSCIEIEGEKITPFYFSRRKRAAKICKKEMKKLKKEYPT